MSGFNLARKAKRTKREQLLQVESFNTQTIQSILQNFAVHLDEDMKVKKDFMILRTVLLQKGVISEAELMAVERGLQELEEMREKGLLIGDKDGG